jgi:mono/diheme cytochrome c family protein
MNRLNLALLAGTITIITAAAAVTLTGDNDTAIAEARVERGRYLVKIMGCNDCHTPWTMGANGPEPDMSRMLSGHPENFKVEPAASAGENYAWSAAVTNTAFSGPWGISFTANLTPDRNTGLGIWTEDMFIKAIRTGRHMGVSRPINPPMPWPMYRNATDEDLKSVFAYLRTIAPVVNHVPEYQPPVTATH